MYDDHTNFTYVVFLAPSLFLPHSPFYNLPFENWQETPGELIAIFRVSHHSSICRQIRRKLNKNIRGIFKLSCQIEKEIANFNVQSMHI